MFTLVANGAFVAIVARRGCKCEKTPNVWITPLDLYTCGGTPAVNGHEARTGSPGAHIPLGARIAVVTTRSIRQQCRITESRRRLAEHPFAGVSTCLASLDRVRIDNALPAYTCKDPIT